MTTSQVSTAGEFLELLAKSRLLKPEQVQQATERDRLHEAPSPKHAAIALIERGLLTKYQAERLISGRMRGYFIDHYKVLEILGLGGMGRIYTAEDVHSGKVVALKVLTERHEVDPGMLERLRIEADAGQRLDHPNVVRTFGTGDTGAVFYMVMEHVRGISLHEVVASFGPLRWRQACDVIGQAAAGLQHAHERGLIHRDVKPANLLVDATGGVKVLDFGLALLKGEDEAEFSLQMIFGHDCLGTADYIAPEQSLNSREIDARADIYSLGATMYYALTGSVPFPEKTAKAKLQAQRSKPLRPIQELVPDISDEAAAVLHKMMAKRPEDRFATAGDVAEQLLQLGRRSAVPIDFDRILAARAKLARQRAALQRQARGSSAIDSSSVTGGPVSGSSLISQKPPAPTARMHEEFETEVESRRVSKPVDEHPVPLQYAEADLVDGMTRTMRAARESLPATSPAYLFPEDSDTPLPLVKSPSVLGRDPSCDIVWDRPGISGRHCEFRFEGNWWTVTDLNSKNGVQIDGVDVRSRMLLPGGELTLAHTYGFRVQDSPTRPARAGFQAWMLWVAALVIVGAGVLWWLLR